MSANIVKYKEKGEDIKAIYHEPYREVFDLALGWRHADILYKYGKEVLADSTGGFMTSRGRYVDRIEGMKLAFIAGQVSMTRAILTRKKGNDNLWVVVNQQINESGEESLSPAMRRLISEEVEEWNNLYSEDLY